MIKIDCPSCGGSGCDTCNDRGYLWREEDEPASSSNEESEREEEEPQSECTCKADEHGLDSSFCPVHGGKCGGGGRG